MQFIRPHFPSWYVSLRCRRLLLRHRHHSPRHRRLPKWEPAFLHAAFPVEQRQLPQLETPHLFHQKPGQPPRPFPPFCAALEPRDRRQEAPRSPWRRRSLAETGPAVLRSRRPNQPPRTKSQRSLSTRKRHRVSRVIATSLIPFLGAGFQAILLNTLRRYRNAFWEVLFA